MVPFPLSELVEALSRHQDLVLELTPNLIHTRRTRVPFLSWLGGTSVDDYVGLMGDRVKKTCARG